MSQFGASFGQHLVASLLIAYLIACFIYGYASLRSRRRISAGATGMQTFEPAGDRGHMRSLAKIASTCFAAVLPVLFIAIFLSVAGRERSGTVEASDLFVVPYRSETTIAHLTTAELVKRGDVIARFTSDELSHRIAALQARRAELLASLEALKSATLSVPSEISLRLQSEEQRVRQLALRREELGRSIFQLNQQLLSARLDWQRQRKSLVATLPALEQAHASQQAEAELAIRNRDRIAQLQRRGYATVMRLDELRTMATVAMAKVQAAGSAFDSAKHQLAALDGAFRDTEALIAGQLRHLHDLLAALEEERAPADAALEEVRKSFADNERSARGRRQFEIEGAKARIEELESEIAAVIAQSEIRSPVAGRVIFRRETASRLTGNLPLLVVAPRHGFQMRLDLARDEVSALMSEVERGSHFDILLTNQISKRIVSARLISLSDDNPSLDRVSALFGLDIPEDMLIQMALRGTNPAAELRWTPSLASMLTTRLAEALGLREVAAYAAEEAGAPPTRVSDGTVDPEEKAEIAL